MASSIEPGAAGAGFGGAEGIARAYNQKGGLLWRIETPLGRNIDHVTYGPIIDESTSAWITSWDDRISQTEVRSIPSGDPILQIEMKSRVNSIMGNSEYLAIGFADGELYLLQGALLTRRLASETESESDEHRSTMAEKLRRLRS